MDLSRFKDIKDTMLWRDAALGQVKNFELLARDFNAATAVVSSHWSKSIALPVVLFELNGGTVVIRDNFHDVNVAVAWRDDFTSRLLASDLLSVSDWAWYLGQIERCRSYTYRGWSDEEMADPRILRVYVQPGTERGYWSSVSGACKDRWVRRMNDTTWYTEDWSRAVLVPDRPLGPDCTFRELHRCYLQGMEALPDEMTRQWRPGQMSGAICLPDIMAARKLMAILEAG